ncbi:uncharacterized protein LOC101723672 isoform X2 [Heterocephalus glaber]|uniref:Uncharacterized protein LOC101723672 isoform X2 n=1 Tax=Heterocephalus glaber TaxID=10181 RepID=A0AAX6QVR5_HETGA|nr:uncharacterized protein LOC101723672 isoform X2 [Heterocephalus glaber]
MKSYGGSEEVREPQVFLVAVFITWEEQGSEDNTKTMTGIHRPHLPYSLAQHGLPENLVMGKSTNVSLGFCDAGLPVTLESGKSKFTWEHLARVILLHPHMVEVSVWRRKANPAMYCLETMIYPHLNDGHTQFVESVTSANQMESDDLQMDDTGGEIKVVRSTASRKGQIPLDYLLQITFHVLLLEIPGSRITSLPIAKMETDEDMANAMMVHSTSFREHGFETAVLNSLKSAKIKPTLLVSAAP